MTAMRLATALSVFLASSPLAVAQEPAVPGALTPAAELLEFMKAFEGTWQCDTTLVTGAIGPDSPKIVARSALVLKKTLGGFWYQGAYDMKKSKGAPAFREIFYIGYDARLKTGLFTSVDDAGGLLAAKGVLQGNSVIFVGDGYMMGLKIKTRVTFAKKGDKTMYRRVETDLGTGFQVMGDDNCKK